MAASPSSSPRLPSPPPIAEDQLGPKSPIAMTNAMGEGNIMDAFEGNAERRIRPGTKACDMALGPPLVALTDIDSPFQLTEHLKSLHNAALHRENSTTVTPIDRDTATRLAQPPDGVDKYLWLYELCRLLCKEINSMIIGLFADSPPCSAATCTEMRASEWQYLCAVHDPPKPCCAIDYCCHTLDWTNAVLTSPKNFPSRMTLEGGGSAGGQGQLRQLTNIFRRVYRIFAHAWFQHRSVYWDVEGRSGLYVFFKTVCDVYNLIPEDNYTVPPEAEGIEAPPVTSVPKHTSNPSIMRREEPPKPEESDSSTKALGNVTTSTGHTTKRHRHTASVGSESITTVMEDPEEEEDKAARLDETVILSSEPPEYSHSPEALLQQQTTQTELGGQLESPTEGTTEFPAIIVERADDVEAVPPEGAAQVVPVEVEESNSKLSAEADVDESKTETASASVSASEDPSSSVGSRAIGISAETESDTAVNTSKPETTSEVQEPTKLVEDDPVSAISAVTDSESPSSAGIATEAIEPVAAPKESSGLGETTTGTSTTEPKIVPVSVTGDEADDAKAKTATATSATSEAPEEDATTRAASPESDKKDATEVEQVEDEDVKADPKADAKEISEVGKTVDD